MPVSSPKVTKEVFLQALPCAARGWYARNGPSETLDDIARLRMAEGQEVHRRARLLHADGVFAGNVQSTAAALANGAAKTIFEAAFEVDGYAARADMLRRKGKKLCLVEVKSSLHNDAKVKDDLIDDLAYTTMVLRRTGLQIDRTELLLLSRDWRLGMPNESLFVEADHTDAVSERVAKFEEHWSAVKEAVLSAKRPTARPLFACKGCDHFDSVCVGKGVDDPVFDLPYLREKKFDALNEKAILSIRHIPHEFDLTDNQRRVRNAVVSGKPWVDVHALKQILAGVRWPAMYLDFETVMTALPLWTGVAPHEQVLTQYSLHVCDRCGDAKDHRAFLADPQRDCRRELAERLLADTKGSGSIVVYNATFEKTMIAGLAARFPDLATRLKALLDRIFDLLKVFTSAYYHPGFRGSSSIKAVLPIVIPGMGYDGLEVGDGDAAIAAFAKMASQACEAAEEARLRKALLDYCRQDTLAMVKLHEVMAQLAE